MIKLRINGKKIVLKPIESFEVDYTPKNMSAIIINDIYAMLRANHLATTIEIKNSIESEEQNDSNDSRKID